jgi:hypothetical protein
VIPAAILSPVGTLSNQNRNVGFSPRLKCRVRSGVESRSSAVLLRESHHGSSFSSPESEAPAGGTLCPSPAPLNPGARRAGPGRRSRRASRENPGRARALRYAAISALGRPSPVPILRSLTQDPPSDSPFDPGAGHARSSLRAAALTDRFYTFQSQFHRGNPAEKQLQPSRGLKPTATSGEF